MALLLLKALHLNLLTDTGILLIWIVVIYQAFCLDVAQGHMNGTPNDMVIVYPIYLSVRSYISMELA